MDCHTVRTSLMAETEGHKYLSLVPARTHHIATFALLGCLSCTAIAVGQPSQDLSRIRVAEHLHPRPRVSRASAPS